MRRPLAFLGLMCAAMLPLGSGAASSAPAAQLNMVEEIQSHRTSAPAAAEPEPACAFETPSRVLLEDGNPHAKGDKRLEIWEVTNSSIWWSQTQPAGPFQDLRAQLETRVTERRPIPLLRQVPSINSELVIASADRWIRPINCLEMLLAGEQHARVPALERPTEFFAIILRSPDGQRLRIYKYTVNEDGIGRATPISEPAIRDHLEGWVVLGNLHNHGFHPGQPVLNGPIAPSVPDAGFNLNFSAQVGGAHAWITNDLDTVDIPPSAFSKFER